MESNVACKIIKKAFLMEGSRPLFLYLLLVNTVDSKKISNLNFAYDWI